MDATATSLTPEDNRDLLGAAAAAFGASGEENERALYEAKRQMVLALGDHPVLVAIRDGLPLSEPGPSGWVMLAFTDDEAAAAWAGMRHPAAPDTELAQSSELGHGGISRKQWVQSLGQLGASSVALNAAGPLGSLVHVDELRTMRPRLLRRGGGHADHPWLDVGARESERARAGQLLAALRTAVDHGDQAALKQLLPELPTLNEIGSLMWAAELQFLSGRHKLAEGNAEDGLEKMIFGSFAWGRFGDPYRCTDGLLEVGGLLLKRNAGDWEASRLSELAEVLERIRNDYREQDVAELLAAAREPR